MVWTPPGSAQQVRRPTIASLAEAMVAEKKVHHLLDLLKSHADYRQLLERMDHGPSTRHITGLAGTSLAYVAAALCHHCQRPAIYVAADSVAAERVREDIATWLGPTLTISFPPAGRVPLDLLADSHELDRRRLTALERLESGTPGVVVTTGEGMLERLPPPWSLRNATLDLHRGSRFDRDELLARLVQAGYTSADPVERPGEFVARGGLIDIYPFTQPVPVRIELAGDAVESLREFDPITQRSGTVREATTVFPARELVLDPATRSALETAIRNSLEATMLRLPSGRGEAASKLRDRANDHLYAPDRWVRRSYLPFAFELVHLVDYLPAHGLILVEELPRIVEQISTGEEVALDILARRMEEGKLLPEEAELYAPSSRLPDVLGRRSQVIFSLLPRKHDQAAIDFRAATPGNYRGRWPSLLKQLSAWREQDYVIGIMASQAPRVDAMVAGLRDAGVPAEVDLPARGRVTVMEGWLRQGFELADIHLAFLAESDVTSRGVTRKSSESRRAGIRIGDIRELREGDFVVHAQHGIGAFEGLQALTVASVTRDYLFIRYAGADRLYVPAEQVESIQKYVGPEGHEPRLNRLGGGEWARTRRRVQESVKALAFDLLRLQAQRQALPGHAFSPDGPWQADMEALFPYEETPDQLRCIREVKEDLERPHPMDRLVLGDVGYGKTEVAIRAAFKVAAEGRQVAVLVPTTVLAQQHYHTFRERLSGFPVKVELMSRLRRPAEQGQILELLSNGSVDIVIGTHRLLQGDVAFRDLGLLVIDEEHRFGVGHKERLKLLKRGVDVLTLSATPIPRTLQTALAGIRATSFIDTPPDDRRPVQTYVCEFGEDLAREAIFRELSRGGQVYYVHNRVETIYRTAERLRALLPGVRLAVAHGQMRENQLEDVFLRFVAGDYSVLVCTTIIEAGLDLPNVNTLIVEDADRLGLAQLYQLRGRVGRSNQLAYAYLTYRRGKVLSEIAEKRLATLREFTELGSGYRVALRDLELRGAGNLLGPEQHGFMVDVGFDLYCRLMEDAVKELRGEISAPKPDVQVDLAVSAFLPTAFVPDQRQRLDLYRRLLEAPDAPRLDDLEAELRDRYGDLPEPARNLLAVARLKLVANKTGLVALTQQGSRVSCRLAPGVRGDPESLARVMRWGRGRVQAAPPRSNDLLILKLEGVQGEEVVTYATAALRQYAGE
jgi:transcription-repair coupling factor (superfamily II helicase)